MLGAERAGRAGDGHAVIVTDERPDQLGPLGRGLADQALDVTVVTGAAEVPRRGAIVLLRVRVAPDATDPYAVLSDLWPLETAEVVLVNPPSALQVTHHVALTARVLALAGVPQVQTVACFDLEDAIDAGDVLGYPVVLRPPYARGGRRMAVCEDEAVLRWEVEELLDHGAPPPGGIAIQELVEDVVDVHVLVADGVAVAASLVLSSPWDGTTSAGPIVVGTALERLARRAVAAVGGDVMSVHMLCQRNPDGVVVLDVNGAPPMSRFGDDAWRRTAELIARRLPAPR